MPSEMEMRFALDAMLRRRVARNPAALIRHELGLCAGQARIDVAVLTRELAGYEIKSDSDTLARLPAQAKVYERVLDRMTLVTTERHERAATRMLPVQWGIVVARERRGALRFTTVRKAAKNTALDAYSLAQLLWRTEALQELKKRGCGRGMGRVARHHVWQALAEAVSVRELRAVALQTLRSRPRWWLDVSWGPAALNPCNALTHNCV